MIETTGCGCKWVMNTQHIHARIELDSSACDVQSLRTQLEQQDARLAEYQREFCAATDAGELARMRQYFHDTSDDMQCLEKCDSYGHEELCPVTNAMAAFRQLRAQLEEKEREIMKLRSVLAEIATCNQSPCGNCKAHAWQALTPPERKEQG